jgi:hypothetical protein
MNGFAYSHYTLTAKFKDKLHSRIRHSQEWNL